jgi:hypothetical protein
VYRFDYASAFEGAFKQLNVEAEIIRIPHFAIETTTPERLQNIRKLLKEKSKGRFLIFCPATAELFLNEADQLFVFSAYQSWWRPKKIKVMPHVWTSMTLPESILQLKWTDKPPLRVGFMGHCYLTSRLVNIIIKSPRSMKKWLLRGYYLKYLNVLGRLYQFGISLKYINAFARAETLKTLNAKKHNYAEIETEIIDTQLFSGSEQEKNQYINHLKRMTYVICPRGIENFSFRVYEALRYGRIPVIINTDMVLPEKIDWDRISVRVPYESLDKIYDIVLRDYNSRSGQDFVERQQIAFSTMVQLDSMRWLKDLLQEVIPVS